MVRRYCCPQFSLVNYQQTRGFCKISAPDYGEGKYHDLGNWHQLVENRDESIVLNFREFY